MICLGRYIRNVLLLCQVAHTFTGHEKSVHCLLPFGRHLISVDELSCVCVWDIATEGWCRTGLVLKLGK